MDNEIQLFYCNLCHLSYKIVKWEKNIVNMVLYAINVKIKLIND